MKTLLQTSLTCAIVALMTLSATAANVPPCGDEFDGCEAPGWADLSDNVSISAAVICVGGTFSANTGLVALHPSVWRYLNTCNQQYSYPDGTDPDVVDYWWNIKNSSGQTVHSGSGLSTGTISAPSTPGTYTVTFYSYTAHTQYSDPCWGGVGWDQESKQFTVVSVASVTPSEGTLLAGSSPPTYVTCAGAGDVVVTAASSPTLAEGSLPACWSFTGGTAIGSGKLQRKVSKSTPGTTTFTATAGSSSKTIKVHVVEIKFDAQSGMINYGFDPEETVYSDGPYPWASVDKDSESDVAKILIQPSEAAEFIELEVTVGAGGYADVAPKTFSSGSTDLTITGEGTAGDAYVVARIGENGPICSALNIRSLPKRTLTVGVYYIEDSTSGSTSPVGGPTANSLIETLNDVFQQAQIEFELEESASKDKPYDANSDGKFQASEAAALNLGGSDYNGDLKIYFIKESGMPYEETAPLNEYFIRGLMVTGGGIVFTDNASNSAALVAAHEIGHQLGLAAIESSEHHDHDAPPWPAGEESLMRDGYPQSSGQSYTLPDPGRWLRHEDWGEANESAGSL